MVATPAPPPAAPANPAPASAVPTPGPANLGGEHEPNELLGVDLDRNTLDVLRSQGYSIRYTSLLPELGVVLSRIRVPLDQSAAAALATLNRSMPRQSFSLNHIYRIATTGPCQGPRCNGLALVGWSQNPAGCFAPMRIGMLDTAVLTEHPALRDQTIVTQRFADAETPADTTHGTAVASLLVGDAASEFPGLLQGSSLFAGDVFMRDEDGGLRSNALMLAEGVDWLLGQRVSVVNISIAGPADRVLQLAMRRLVEKGVIPVAAAGNGGPSAAPAYPAAYDGVVAVTAVDRRLRPYRQANRGDYLSFAAPGVQVWIPNSDGSGGSYQQGTSFAAPYVTAAAATLLRRQSQGATPAELIGELGRGARDLGAPGRDEVYGWGLVQALGSNCP